MERKRSRSGLSYDEEEEYRRISPRRKKSLQYHEDGSGDDDIEEEEEEEEEDDEEDTEQQGPSTQNTHNQTTRENRFLTVTCGSKKGVLDTEKLKRGEECIKCDDRWYSPPAFEGFGGKSNHKKWRTSILYKTEPLQCLFETGDLTTKGFERRGAEPIKQKKKTSSNLILTLESSSEERELKGIFSTPVESALRMKVKVVIKKLQFQATTDCRSNRMEPPLEDSWCKPLEDGEHNGSGIDETAATDTDPSKMSDPPIAEGAEKENGEKFTQSNERKEDGHSKIKTQTRNSPSPLSAPATSLPPEPETETEDIESTGNRAAILSSSSTDTGFLGDIKGRRNRAL